MSFVSAPLSCFEPTNQARRYCLAFRVLRVAQLQVFRVAVHARQAAGQTQHAQEALSAEPIDRRVPETLSIAGQFIVPERIKRANARTHRIEANVS